MESGGSAFLVRWCSLADQTLAQLSKALPSLGQPIHKMLACCGRHSAKAWRGGCGIIKPDPIFGLTCLSCQYLLCLQRDALLPQDRRVQTWLVQPGSAQMASSTASPTLCAAVLSATPSVHPHSLVNVSHSLSFQPPRLRLSDCHGDQHTAGWLQRDTDLHVLPTARLESSFNIA